MKKFFKAFAQLMSQTFIASLVMGMVDACVTIIGSSEVKGGTRLFSVAIGILGFDPFVIVLICTPLLVILAAIAPVECASPRDVVRLLAKSLWPIDVVERARRGLCWLIALISAALFLGLDYLMALLVIERVRTTTYAATLVAGVALALGLFLLFIAFRTYRILLEKIKEPVPKWARHLSPALAIAICIVGLGAVLGLQRENVKAVITATPLGWLTVLAIGFGVWSLVALLPPLSSWRRASRLAVLAGVPITALSCLLLSLLWLGQDNTVRRVVSSEGLISPFAYNTVKTLLDFDNDGYMCFMGEGDCAPFDPFIYPGAPETPNNGLDEDCNGSDLDLVFSDEELRARWDYPVPSGVKQRPNIILLTIDAIAPSRMASYGYWRVTTPFLDDFARKSVHFVNAFSQGPSTRLAFPAMFTSRYDTQISYNIGPKQPHELLPDNLTMAEVMKSAGYRTVAVLPWSYFRDWKGITQGFERINEDALPFYKAPEYHNAPKVTEAALSEIQVNDGRPLFLWLHYFDPHGPYTRPPEGSAPDFGDSDGDVYDAELYYTDAEVKRFVERLDQVFPPSETLLIICGDHGEAFDDAHPKRHHGYDIHSLVLHIPLMIRAPFAQPKKVTVPVSAMDILPTIVNLLAISGNFTFEGNSLLPYLFGGGEEGDRVIFHEFFLPENLYHRKSALRLVGIRTASLYLIEDLTNNTVQLYRYKEDPTEDKNLADEMPDVVAMLRAELARFRLRTAR